MRLILCAAILVWATASSAQPVVTDLSTTTTTEVIFTVKENTDSPYQGRLVMTPAAFAAMTQAQRRAAKLQQFQAWKIVRDAPRPPITRDMLIERRQQMRDERQRIQSEEDQLQIEIDATP